MIFTNFNLINSLLVVLIIFWSVWLTFYYYKKDKEIQKKYRLLWNKSRFKFLWIVFLALSLILLSFSILWPKWWIKGSSIKNEWIDIVFALDVSKSMQVQDVNFDNWKHSRLDASKLLIQDFIKNHISDRLGLVVFAWDSTSISPLTLDYDIFLTFLAWVDRWNVTDQWTDLLSALTLSTKRFGSWDDRSKLVVLISDWWDEDQTYDFKNISETFKTKNINLIIIWVWSFDGWYIPTGQDPFWQIYYKTYQWKEVLTKLNEKYLKQLSDEIGWKYINFYDQKSVKSVQKFIDWLQKKILNASVWSEKKDLTRLLSMFSLILFLLFVSFVSSNKNVFRK